MRNPSTATTAASTRRQALPWTCALDLCLNHFFPSILYQKTDVARLLLASSKPSSPEGAGSILGGKKLRREAERRCHMRLVGYVLEGSLSSYVEKRRTQGRRAVTDHTQAPIDTGSGPTPIRRRRIAEALHQIPHVATFQPRATIDRGIVVATSRRGAPRAVARLQTTRRPQ